MLQPINFALILALILSGCATMTEGTDQDMLVQTIPAGGQCTATREGKPLFQARDGQGVRIGKSRHAITFHCELGQLAGDQVVESHVTTMGAAGVALDFGLTDYATGALNAYPSVVTVRLQPAGAK